jgi:hypothetical protein
LNGSRNILGASGMIRIACQQGAGPAASMIHAKNPDALRNQATRQSNHVSALMRSTQSMQKQDGVITSLPGRRTVVVHHDEITVVEPETPLHCAADFYTTRKKSSPNCLEMSAP